ncbi:MORN repeat-containing protein 3-like [Agrilus planipennis]|uniref:MORN repeat-containing protein 3 n=1 Tax=Agrilus planipennis TaxID=224129 RepID=A0A1W4W6D4_AGRPL|nr:MORN repeat-containing protein 3-like [Agrilus planipennis]
MPFKKTELLKSRSKELEKLSEKNGLRHSIYSIGKDKYKGEWKNNLKDGKGVYLSRTKQLYEGDWAENYRHGFGILAVPLEKIFILKYRGDWRRGLYGGFGEEHYPDGSYYIGYFKNSKKHGEGEMWYADASYYYGDWRRGGRHGFGMFIEPPIEPRGKSYGNRYEGQWANDLKHGKGRYFHLDSGQMQEGVWREDICIFSVMIDIYFRQSAVIPSPYPIPPHQLQDIDGVCNKREAEALENADEPCSISSFTHSSKSTVMRKETAAS